MSKLNAVRGALVGAVAVPGLVLAQDYTAITSAVDFTTAGTAIGVVIGASALMYVIWKGGKMVVNAIK